MGVCVYGKIGYEKYPNSTQLNQSCRSNQFSLSLLIGSTAVAQAATPAKRVTPSVKISKAAPGKVVIYVRASKNTNARLEVTPCPYASTAQSACAKAEYPTVHRVISKRAEVLTYLVSVSPNEREEGTLTLLVPVKTKTGASVNLEYVSTIQVEQRSATTKPVILYTKPTLVKQAKPTGLITPSSSNSGSGSGSTGG